MLRTLADGGRQGRVRVDERMPRPIKRAFYWLLDRLLIDRLTAAPLNEFRATLGLPPVQGIFREYLQSPDLVLGLFPDWFGSIQPDWPSHTHLPGFVLHDDGERQTVTADVEEFLASGPPPVLFTPGSVASMLRDFFRESVEACRRGGFRAMLVTSFPEQLPRDLPPGVRAFSYLPFSEILPHCAALVHPGGIGTIAQGIKAGIPHLIVPHSNDQPDNAFRIERLGLGAAIYPERYRAARVARVLSRLLGSPAIRGRCREFAPRVDSSAAVDCACGLLEGLGRASQAVPDIHARQEG
jgi:UDP:flavonoid glycosyltransferase YjiC (YdhE family)